MWTDNTTDKDFLGFDVHLNLIKEIVKDEKMLPITIGLFGDWGSGKSSILGALKKELDGEPKTACLYFNGWVFEGYDDAKAALIEAILKEFENETKFGTKIKEDVKKLYKSVDWMRVMGFSLKNIALPVTTAFFTGGISVIPQIVSGLKDAVAVNPEKLIGQIKGEGAESFITKFVNHKNGDDRFDVIRNFRNDFEDLLEKSDIDKLIILIDDLDRCLPDRIIDNLEAIKLFLNVKNTAFVIGADPRIVRHAIEYRYRDKFTNHNSENTNDRIVDDYLEKLIQVPYSLPKLSDSEVETYIMLLFCESDLDNPDDFDKVLNAFKEFRTKERYSVFDFVKVKNALGENFDTEKLENNVSLIAKLSPIISESLYGNPRQIKRFLNSFILRKKLAEIAHIEEFKDDILAKLMILEYAEPNLFEALYNWQISNQGYAKELKLLEEACRDKKEIKPFEGDLKYWNKPKIINWLGCDPKLSDVDLRDYYWLSRDNLNSMQSNLLLPPIVKSLMVKLEPEGMAKKLTINILKTELDVLDENTKSLFFKYLKQRAISNPENNRYYEIFDISLDEGFDCKDEFVDTLKIIGNKVPPGVFESLNHHNEKHPEFNQFIKVEK